MVRMFGSRAAHVRRMHPEPDGTITVPFMCPSPGTRRIAAPIQRTRRPLSAPMTLNESWFAPLVGILVLLAAAGAITAAVHFLLFRVVARLARLSATRVDDALFEFGAFSWLNRIVPFVVIKLGLGAVPGIPDTAAQVADKVLFALEHTHRTHHRASRDWTGQSFIDTHEPFSA